MFSFFNDFSFSGPKKTNNRALVAFILNFSTVFYDKGAENIIIVKCLFKADFELFTIG
jgi:hypothetical protein